MKILFLCGEFGEENIEYIASNAKRAMEYSADIFQKKLMKGFQLNKLDISVISAPFVGSFPNASGIVKFKSRCVNSLERKYVSFNNIWGIRNFSRAKALKKGIQDFINNPDEEKMVVVYSPHTPFLDAAVYAKKMDPRIKICLVVPDLPQYMNLDTHISIVYRIAKKFDIARFYKLNQKVDSFVLLTEEMKHRLFVGNRPYMVAEGIVDTGELSTAEEQQAAVVHTDHLRHIVYTGKMNMKFGVKNLIDTFLNIPDETLRLVLCGKGDMEDYVFEKSRQDSRILYVGQVSPEEAKEWMYRASVLVNPRKNDEEYTKYSFPSKNIEYLMTGNPVVAYMLDGIPKIYNSYFVVVNNDNLEEAIYKALTLPKHRAFVEYANSNLINTSIAKRILDITLNDCCTERKK